MQVFRCNANWKLQTLLVDDHWEAMAGDITSAVGPDHLRLLSGDPSPQRVQCHPPQEIGPCLRDYEQPPWFLNSTGLFGAKVAKVALGGVSTLHSHDMVSCSHNSSRDLIFQLKFWKIRHAWSRLVSAEITTFCWVISVVSFPSYRKVVLIQGRPLLDLNGVITPTNGLK